MKERPIIFSGESVRAILDGRKTQTRRVMKPQPEPFGSEGGVLRPLITACPYGYIGDRVWVKETFVGDDCMGYLYQADFTPEEAATLKTGGLDDGEWQYRRWQSPIFMPRAFSRLTLEITSVRVERIQDISGAECDAEGIVPNNDPNWHLDLVGGVQTEIRVIRAAFESAWEQINGKKHPWSENPWVWVIEFKMVDSAGNGLREGVGGNEG